MDPFDNKEGQSFFSNVKNFLWRKRASSVMPFKVNATFLQLKEIGFDENFSHFTSLAESIFNVPLAIVHLTDHEAQRRKKSTSSDHVGRDVDENRKETPVQMALFVDLPQGNTVSVINDKGLDLRLKLSGVSFIRFYAGVALYIGVYHI
jgi:hypothetical protein